jgi:capsid protein
MPGPRPASRTSSPTRRGHRDQAPKPFMDERFKASVQALWRDWCEEADAAELTDFYGLQALACRAMLEGGESLIRLRPRRPGRRPTPPCAPMPALAPSAPCCEASSWERYGTSGCCAAESRAIPS